MRAPLLFLLFSISTNSYSLNSYYCATGKIQGNVCEGFLNSIIQSCKKVEINAVKNEGQFYTMKKCYNNVSDYRDGLCWIYIESVGGGIFANGIDEDTRPDFYTYKNGIYTKHNIEYLVFKCEKTANNKTTPVAD